MRLYTVPAVSSISSGGVFAVIAAHEKYLRELGVEYVKRERDADLVIVHALARTDRVDVFHSHGFYPTVQPGWNSGFDRANETLIQTMMMARAVVSVGELAAEVMRRDFHIQPKIIRNGVNFHEIKQGGRQDGFALWPKMNVSPTCDPGPLMWLAEKRKGLPLAALVNIKGVNVFGRMSHADFLELLRNCSIYLGTTRENNSMGEMESFAIGVPVIGYNWGFNREHLQSGYGCELVEPGDLDGLSQAITAVLGNWRSYHEQAIEFARSNFGWDEPIRQIYQLYKGLL